MVDFSPDVGIDVCKHIAAGKSLRTIAKIDGMPCASTIMLWASKGSKGDEEYAAFAEQYTRAMEARVELMAEEILDISDDGLNDYTKKTKGEEVVNSDHIQRSRLRVDSRKWLMAKMMPKKYGDKAELTHQNPDGTPMAFSVNFLTPPPAGDEAS